MFILSSQVRHIARQKRQVIHWVSLQSHTRLDASLGMNRMLWPTGSTTMFRPQMLTLFPGIGNRYRGRRPHLCPCLLTMRSTQRTTQTCWKRLARDDYSVEDFWRKWQVSLPEWQGGGGWAKPRERGEGHSGWEERPTRAQASLSTSNSRRGQWVPRATLHHACSCEQTVHGTLSAGAFNLPCPHSAIVITNVMSNV